jgi:hypothetical protein
MKSDVRYWTEVEAYLSGELQSERGCLAGTRFLLYTELIIKIQLGEVTGDCCPLFHWG